MSQTERQVNAFSMSELSLPTLPPQGIVVPFGIGVASLPVCAVVDTSTCAFKQVHTRIRAQRYEKYLKRQLE